MLKGGATLGGACHVPDVCTCFVWRMWCFVLLVASCCVLVVELALIVTSLWFKRLSRYQYALTSSPVISQELIGVGSFGKVFPGEFM